MLVVFRVFINSWGNYNLKGVDGGKWIALPMENAALAKPLMNWR